MKKLLVLALVLSMATLANAALTLTISGPTELATGAVGTYTITSAGASISGLDLDVLGSLGTITGGAVIATGRVSTLDVAGINGASGNFELVAVNDGPAEIFSPLFTFNFTAGTVAGQGSVSLIENSIYDLGFEPITGTEMPSFAVTITPEPMTLGLLGLGGLFLRRRSK